MADIIVRGMEMPKTCVQCDLKRYDQERIWNDNGTELLGAWVCKRTDEIIWNTQRGENCPLLYLPEGYGRLIDADALMLKIGDVPYKGSVRRVLLSAPTVIPAEGGGEMENNICFTCKHVSEYPECPATNDDIVFASNGDTIVSCKAYEEMKGDSNDGRFSYQRHGNA